MYTTQAKVEAYIGRDLTQEEETLLNDVLATIKSTIDNYTNREWVADIEDVEFTTRLFDTAGERELFVDDFIELENIELLDIEGDTYDILLPSELVLRPHNSSYKNSISREAGYFPWRTRGVKISAKWTTGQTPAEVTNVATQLVGDFFNSYAKQNGYKRESIEGYSYEVMSGEQALDIQHQKLRSLQKWIKINL